MNLILEKEKIIKTMEALKDKGLLGGLKWFVLLYDPEDTYSDLKDSPIASWEMSMPFGRKPTRKQLSEYLDRDGDDKKGVVFTIEQLKEGLKKRSEERKRFWDAI